MGVLGEGESVVVYHTCICVPGFLLGFGSVCCKVLDTGRSYSAGTAVCFCIWFVWGGVRTP